MSIFDLFKEQDFFKTDARAAKRSQEKLPSLYSQCKSCKQPIENEKLKSAFGVCPHCDFHHHIPYQHRIELIYDEGKCKIFHENVKSIDILSFKDRKSYAERLTKYAKSGQDQDAFISTQGKLEGIPVSIGFFNFKFLGGSMGSVVGEKVCLLFEKALKEKTPVIIFHETGGARMQEGLFSLFQMGKTSMVLQKYKKTSPFPYISVLCYPTTGGVAASFAIAGDINIAEKDSLIGFAGKRVIQQAIRKPLPEGFQSAEYVYQKGMVDQVLHRHDLKVVLGQLIKLLVRT